MAKPNIGISACLLGEAVRYDGDHSRNQIILSELADHVEWVSICPECEIGLGVPRPPIQLVKHIDGIHAQGVEDITLDVSNALSGLPEKLSEQLSICSGFILKSRSPSCGVGSVKLFESDCQSYERVGTGLFAAALMQRYPHVPIVEESALNSTIACQQFLAQCQPVIVNQT